jgi:hypothetical protein
MIAKFFNAKIELKIFVLDTEPVYELYKAPPHSMTDL